MTRTSHRLGRLVVLAIGLATMLVPAADAGILRSSGVGETEVTGRHGIPYPQGMNPSGTATTVSFDRQSPDTRDAALAGDSSVPAAYNVAARQRVIERHVVDFRSPDARDAGLAGDESVKPTLPELGYNVAAWQQAGGRPDVLLDSRSPDTRDAADGRLPGSAPTVEIVQVSEPGGFSWDDAGIGALGAFILMLLAGSSALVIRTMRRTRLANA
jgi:hypothetical protein